MSVAAGSAAGGVPRVALAAVACLLVVYGLLQSFASWEWSSGLPTARMTAFPVEPFPEKIVHLDLKGAPFRVAAYEPLFPLLKQLGTTGLLIEYEDMFPYDGGLKIVRRRSAYSTDDVARILGLADRSGLEAIPLVQTFGHLEFVLKHPNFFNISENPFQRNTICISNEAAWETVKSMLDQIRIAHPNSKRIHIGADEAYHVGEDALCARRLEREFGGEIERMKVAHIARVAKYARLLGFETVFAWNDMFDKTPVEVLKEFDLGNLVTPVVWGYKEDVTVLGYFPDGLFERMAEVFPSVYFGTAFKGANGQANPFISIDRYMVTHHSYVKLLHRNASVVVPKTGGVFLTGWSRFDHTRPLCELLPAALPSLIADLIYLRDVTQRRVEVDAKLYQTLNCSNSSIPSSALSPRPFANLTYFPPIETAYSHCEFLWSDVYKLVEDLRFLTWRAENTWTSGGTLREETRREIAEFEERAHSVLSPLYFEDTVNEFITQNVRSLINRLDEGPSTDQPFY